MTRFRSRDVVEAHQWFKNGDHPEDRSVLMTSTEDGEPFLTEGRVVRRYRHPTTPGNTICRYCNHTMQHHGFLDQQEASTAVCPGMWIVTRDSPRRRYETWTDSAFKEHFEVINE